MDFLVSIYFRMHPYIDGRIVHVNQMDGNYPQQPTRYPCENVAYRRWFLHCQVAPVLVGSRLATHLQNRHDFCAFRFHRALLTRCLLPTFGARLIAVARIIAGLCRTTKERPPSRMIKVHGRLVAVLSARGSQEPKK